MILVNRYRDREDAVPAVRSMRTQVYVDFCYIVLFEIRD